MRIMAAQEQGAEESAGAAYNNAAFLTGPEIDMSVGAQLREKGPN